MVLLELWLVVKQVDVRRPARHEQVDHALRPGREVQGGQDALRLQGVVLVGGEQPSPGAGLLSGIDQRHLPGFCDTLVNFHRTLLHVKGHIGHMKEIVSKVLLNHVSLVSAADDEIVDPIV